MKTLASAGVFLFGYSLKDALQLIASAVPDDLS
jgi:hypothetical protein